MKKIFMLMVMGLFMAGSVYASSMRIAYIDFQKVFESYYKTDQVNKDLKGKTDEWQGQLDKYKKEISALKENYDKNESKMSDSDKKKAREEIMGKLQKYQSLGQDLTGKLKKLQYSQYEKIKEDIQKFLERFGKREKYNLILDRAVVFYGGTDITDKVIKQLNKGHKKK
jgi:outer membrane protein